MVPFPAGLFHSKVPLPSVNLWTRAINLKALGSDSLRARRNCRFLYLFLKTFFLQSIDFCHAYGQLTASQIGFFKWNLTPKAIWGDACAVIDKTGGCTLNALIRHQVEIVHLCARDKVFKKQNLKIKKKMCLLPRSSA